MQRRTRLLPTRSPIDSNLATLLILRSWNAKQLEIDSQTITRQSLNEFPFCQCS